MTPRIGMFLSSLTLLFVSACGVEYTHSADAYFEEDWATSYTKVHDCKQSATHGGEYVEIWVDSAAAAGYAATMERGAAESLAALTAFLAIACGAALCAPAGWLADRVGKARVSAGALTGSGAMALAVAATHGGPVWLSFGLVLLWGALVIPDSAQFSAMIADAAPPEAAGSLMTMQTALGFALTIFTVQATPLAAAAIGWPMTLALMAAGPAFGVAMLRPLLGRL